MLKSNVSNPAPPPPNEGAPAAMVIIEVSSKADAPVAAVLHPMSMAAAKDLAAVSIGFGFGFFGFELCGFISKAMRAGWTVGATTKAAVVVVVAVVVSREMVAK